MNREEVLERHKKLEGEGWLRRFTAEEPRLSEMKEFYESRGLEVLVETFGADEAQECQTSFDEEGDCAQYKTIYTRGEEPGEKGESNDLFD
jgi:hypothetical protein